MLSESEKMNLKGYLVNLVEEIELDQLIHNVVLTGKNFFQQFTSAVITSFLYIRIHHDSYIKAKIR